MADRGAPDQELENDRERLSDARAEAERCWPPRQHLLDLISRKHTNWWPGGKVGQASKG
jgi:hypothetical protein